MFILPPYYWCWGLVSHAPAPLSHWVRAYHWLPGHALRSFCSLVASLTHLLGSTCQAYASYGGHSWKSVHTTLFVVPTGVLLLSGSVG